MVCLTERASPLAKIAPYGQGEKNRQDEQDFQDEQDEDLKCCEKRGEHSLSKFPEHPLVTN